MVQEKYGPTVIQLSTDENFAADKTTTVYNSDKDNVHKQGAGQKMSFYVETAAGKRDVERRKTVNL